MGSELFISLNQEGDLPPGYINKNRPALTKLSAYLQLLPEWILAYLEDETTKDLTVDDENGVFSQYLPHQGLDQPTVIISAPELSEPERREEVINMISEEFKPILDQLPHLYLLFESPADE